MLRIFFPRKQQQKQNHVFDSELDGCLLTRKDFAIRLRHERLKSERSGSPLALVIIDFGGLLDFMLEKISMSPRVFARHLADVIRTYTRETDLKGWYLEGKIALIAADTNGLNAQILARKLGELIGKEAGSKDILSENDLTRFISISSVESGRSYLAGHGDDKESTASVRSGAQCYRLDFSCPAADMPYRQGSDQAICVAAEQWPFSFEILNKIRGKEFQLKVKRAMDIIGSLTGILLFGPLMLIIGALVKLTSPGFVLFCQERIGFLGKPFTFLKFRSMKAACTSSVHKNYVAKLIKGENSEINNGMAGQAVYKITDDPRVTPIGKILRKSSLDELPQFFNVLKGDMSLVGPRPPIPYECDQYKRWHCGRVLEVKPGITGLWQVNGRSSTTFDEMVRLDLKYVRTWSLCMDTKILFKTFWAVISGKGGY
jgi:lipopolysaccharide/colanic/teichoic acid biosynthesis glycosyltransferase/GGDEF domain-containing protein